MAPSESMSRRALLVAGSIGIGTFLGKPDEISRQGLLTEADDVASRWGVYTAYQLSWMEHLGAITAPDEPPGVQAAGYEPNPLAAIKYHPETGDTDDGSWRRIDEDNPRWQWHIHVWEDGEDAFEVFSHYEYRPDPWTIAGESIGEMRQRLRDHYSPKWSVNHPPDEANYFLGEACDRIGSLLDDP